MDCCATCKRRLALNKFDYSEDGCTHSEPEGFACLAFASEGVVVWMVGTDEAAGMCECYEPKNVMVYPQVEGITPTVIGNHDEDNVICTKASPASLGIR